MPSYEKRVRRRRRGSGVLPALIITLAVVAGLLVLALVNGNFLSGDDINRLPFAYPENPNFVEQGNATVEPLVLGSQHTPQPTANINPTPTPKPAENTQANEGENAVDAEDDLSRLIPTPKPGDYFLPVFDRALRTPDDEMMISITVDDCDEAEVMTRILDIARKYNVQLTLFPTGEALMAQGMTEGFETCVRRWGYQLENHSFAHKAEYRITNSELAIQLWKQSIAADYAVGDDYEQHFYRPYNNASVYDQRTHYYAGKLGYLGIAGYSHSYKEFINHDKQDPDRAKNLSAMVDTLENGKIYQFDMTEDSMALFEPFIAAASSKGYKLVTMNRLFGLNENVIGDTLTIDQQTLITMEDYVATYYDLKLNYRTNAVYALQNRLMQLGYMPKLDDDGNIIKADGIYGADTSIAVSAFQAKVGIAADGNANVATQEKLFAPDAPMAG